MQQKLQDINNKISELKKSKKFLIIGLKKSERINELKTKENNELKDVIKKLKESKIESGGLPELIEDIEKKDNKSRTFAPPDKDEERLKDLAIKLTLDDVETPKDFDIYKLFENKYLDINLGDVNDLVGRMKENIKKNR